MVKRRGVSITNHFEDLEDRRIERSNRNRLLDIISIAICAVICGADSWVYVEMLSGSKEEWFVTFLKLPNGAPSHDTPAFAGAGPSAMCFPGWTRSSFNGASCSGPRQWRTLCLGRC